MISKRGLYSLAHCGRGVGTLVEPVKYEPRETACRMAEGVKKHKMSTPCGRTEIFDFEEGAFIYPPTYVGGGVGRGGHVITNGY